MGLGISLIKCGAQSSQPGIYDLPSIADSFIRDVVSEGNGQLTILICHHLSQLLKNCVIICQFVEAVIHQGRTRPLICIWWCFWSRQKMIIQLLQRAPLQLPSTLSAATEGSSGLILLCAFQEDTPEGGGLKLITRPRNEQPNPIQCRVSGDMHSDSRILCLHCHSVHGIHGML